MKKVLSVIALLVVMSVPAFGSLALLSPGDAIIAVDPDGLVSTSRYPGGEPPAAVLDENSGTKYLNFAKENTGFIVTPGVASVVQSFTMTTANDALQRDPASWILYGTNSAISSTDNSRGLAESWALIGSGAASLPDARQTLGPVTSLTNSTSYASYKMIYPTLKDAGATNSMQLADVMFYESGDGTGSSVFSTSDAILAVGENAEQNSRYPDGEAPGYAIDGTLSKYLNFGAANSGFIVTPGMGSTIVDSFQLTTANDSPERDPSSWELYGTDDAILSGDNTEGTGEIWTLIASGAVALPEDRDMLGPLVAISNSTAYASYKMLFTGLKDAGAANSMQIAEIQLYGVPEPATICLLGLGGLSLLRRRKR
jgi:hypothetical protein